MRRVTEESREKRAAIGLYPNKHDYSIQTIMFQCRAVLSKCKTTSVRFNSSSSSSIPKLGTTPNKFNSKSSAFNLRPNLPEGLFYHPAPAAPSPEITPKAFLPKSDARASSDLYYPEQEALVSANVAYMPVISKTSQPKNYKFDASIVEQLQALRDQGVSRKQIKEKFNVTDHFISLVTKPNPQTQQQQKKLLKKSARKWSAKTLKARTLKEVKKLQWERDL